MAQTYELRLQPLAALEAEVRRRYGRSAPGVLFNLPIDTPERIRALSRLLGEPEPTDLEAVAQQKDTRS